MKRIFAVFLIICLLAGCNAPEEPFHEGKLSDAPFIPSGREAYEAPFMDWLRLPHYLDEDVDLSANQELFGERISLALPDFPETVDETLSGNEEALGEIFAELKSKVPDIETEKWKFTFHYLTNDKSCGMIKFQYFIGEDIRTDKAAIFSFENGAVNHVSYSNLSAFCDEEEKIRMKEEFLETHIQEKRVFEEREEFLEDETTFSYYYGTDTLVYCYQLYFYEETDIGKVINNDYVSEYIVENEKEET